MKRCIWLWLVGVLVFGSGCEQELQVEDEGTELELKVLALDGNCSSDGSAAAITKYRIRVMDNSTTPAEAVADVEIGSNEKVLRLNKIPESTDLELTLLGLTGDSKAPPVAFSRARGIQVLKGKVTQVDLSLGEYADYSCLTPPAGEPNVVFPTVTSLPNGLVLIAGGFTLAKDGSGAFEVTGPSDRGYIYDPTTGEVRKTANLMNRGRGAHSAVLLPKLGKVLLVGGADRLYMEKSQAKFPWYFRKEMMGDVGNTYELFDVKTESFLNWEENWPDKDYRMRKPVRRVFPGVSLNNDGTVLVTGGGQWRSAQTKFEVDTDYQSAEVYRPAAESYEGGFMDTFGALTTKAMRAGHATVLMEVKDKLAVQLLWGGSEDGPIAEVYRESSGQLDGNFGMFQAIEFVEPAQYPHRPFFHTITPLKDRQFLVVGGALYKSGALAAPEASHAYLVRVGSDEPAKLSVQAVKGLSEGRYFHQAYTFDNEHVVVFGGFGSQVKVEGESRVFSQAAMSDMRFFDLTSKSLNLPPFDKAGMARGGLGMGVLPNDCVVMVGGVDTPPGGLEFESGSLSLVVEQFCPSLVCPESMWDNACYPSN